MNPLMVVPLGEVGAGSDVFVKQISGREFADENPHYTRLDVNGLPIDICYPVVGDVWVAMGRSLMRNIGMPKSILYVIMVNCASSIDEVRQKQSVVKISNTASIFVATYTNQRKDQGFHGFSTEDGLALANEVGIPYREATFDPNDSMELLEILNAGIEHLHDM
jgi:hypothetical protein